MGCNEKVLDKIAVMEQRANERTALLHTIWDCSREEGSEGVANELARQIGEIRGKFNALLAKLNDML